jgi:hypothetical protein
MTPKEGLKVRPQETNIRKKRSENMFQSWPEADELDTEARSLWLQQEVPWYGSFSCLDYPSQIPINILQKIR